MLHRLAPAGRAGYHRRPGPSEQVPAVGPRDAIQRDALVRGVHRADLVNLAEHGDVILADVLFDEVGDRAAKGAGDLQQRRDGRHHAALLDLVYRGRGHVRPLAELLQREPHALAQAEHLEPDGADDPLEFSGRGDVKAGRSLRTRHLAHRDPAAMVGDRVLTLRDALAIIVYESSRILNVY